ncbi:sperm-egg fusion protein TMEM95 isoform X7 [Oryctolagus cuniculus]|uniref:sperm-egg fusion protein TMEM95 isoform X7 n=1 Tax=Oryctolagus cuniculus TaxID=9986 RepID=UPI0022304A71|nr:sperm-egg fusion protein TMEM95 isoform X7 [Oryctolagus cuniculus]
MRSLALAGVFLAATQACIFCRLPDRDLSGRLARLCSQMEAQWKEWASPDFSAFALEIKRSLSSLPPYWQWLQKTLIPQYTREALCAPACRVPRCPVGPESAALQVPTPPSRQVTGEMLTAASKRGIPHTSTSSPPWSQPS